MIEIKDIEHDEIQALVEARNFVEVVTVLVKLDKKLEGKRVIPRSTKKGEYRRKRKVIPEPIAREMIAEWDNIRTNKQKRKIAKRKGYSVGAYSRKIYYLKHRND